MKVEKNRFYEQCNQLNVDKRRKHNVNFKSETTFFE